MTQKIHWTPAKLAQFKEKIKAAREAGHETFMFEGHDIYVKYADYLVKYLDDMFNMKG